ncbi:MAG TPA: hypothetical protein VIM53_04270 [Candidatus Saccharimonadales bacterium]
MTTFLSDNHYYFAQAYGEGTYSACNYNDSTSCTTSSSSSGSGTLANTGTMVLLVVSVACLIIFVALIVRFWRRPKRAKPLDSPEQSVLQSDYKDKHKQ